MICIRATKRKGGHWPLRSTPRLPGITPEQFMGLLQGSRCCSSVHRLRSLVVLRRHPEMFSAVVRVVVTRIVRSSRMSFLGHRENQKAAGCGPCGLCLLVSLGGLLRGATSRDKGRRTGRMWAAEAEHIHRQLDTRGPPGIPPLRCCGLLGLSGDGNREHVHGSFVQRVPR